MTRTGLMEATRLPRHLPRRAVNRAVLGVSLAAAAALALSSCATSAASSSGHAPLTVAVFNPFTGPDGAFGPDLMAACQAATNLVNSAGGVSGHTMKCQSVDTRGDSADAVPAADQMIATTSNLVAVIGPSADEAEATVPLIDGAQIPMFADTGEAAFDHSNFQYFYRLTPADDAEGYAMALWAKKQGYTRAGLVFGNDIGAQAIVPTLVSSFQKAGGTIVANQSLAGNQASYRTEVERMVAAQPQVIFTEADPATSATYFNELSQLHGLIPVIGSGTTSLVGWEQAVGNSIGKASMAKYFVGVTPAAATTGPAVAAFTQALLGTGTGNKYANDSFAENAYDGATLTALAILAAKSTDPKVFAKQIVGLTQASPGAVTVYTFAQGKTELAAGHPIRYVGAGGSISFDRSHNTSGDWDVEILNGLARGQVAGTITADEVTQLVNS